MDLGAGEGGDSSEVKASQIQIPSIPADARWAWQPTHDPTTWVVLEGSWLARLVGPVSSGFRRETLPQNLRRRVIEEDTDISLWPPLMYICVPEYMQTLSWLDFCQLDTI